MNSKDANLYSIEDGPIEQRPGCVAKAVEVVGDKWSPLIIRELADGSSRFTELQKILPGISPRTLSQRLDYLARQEIITRKIYAEMPPRVQYELTKKGRDLVPILRQMAEWGFKYHTATTPPRHSNS